MPADYKSRSIKAEKKPLPGFIWLLIGLAIGLFVALIIYLDKQPQPETGFAEAVQQEIEQLRSNSTSSAETVARDRTHHQPPRFNFYTILPELEVLIPDSELQLDQTQSPPQAAPGKQLQLGKRYVLQAGSFKNRADADRLRARLTLLALDASIHPVSIDQQQWFRVRVGPFHNTRALQESLNRLQQNGIQAMAMELKNQ